MLTNNKDRFNDAMVKDRFNNAIEELNQQNEYLTVEVTKLGYPIASKQVPTAGVMWDEVKKKIIFMFNPDFEQTLNKEEFKFVVAHEAMHLLNCHIFLIKEKIDYMKKLNKSNNEILKFRKKINIAADCVVNDSLVNLYGFKKCFTEKGAKIKIFYGKETVNMECHDSTAMDVFYLLPEDINKNENVDNHDNWESFFDNVGNIHKDFIDAFKEIVDSNIENSALTDQEKDKLDEIKNTFKENSDAYVAQVGNTIGQKNRPIDGFSKESLNWNKILNNVTQDKKQQDVWTKPNRRLISTYPELLLPSVESTEREDLFIAIDSSGSIDPEKLKLFLSILKNTPKRFNIHSITFDRKCYFYDIKSNNDPQGGGGTTFSIIENYIQENFKKYPKCVVVFTDGFGNVVTPQYPNRWLWILYGSDTSTRYCDTMKHYQLQDLLK